MKSVGYFSPGIFPTPAITQSCKRCAMHSHCTSGGRFMPQPHGAESTPIRYQRSSCLPVGGQAVRYRPAILRQDVKEVWFAGCHSDVGRGYPPGLPRRRCLAALDARGSPAHGLMISHAAEVNNLATTITKWHLHDELARHETWKDWPSGFFGKTSHSGFFRKTARGGFFGRLLTNARVETSKTSSRRLEKSGDICRPGHEISVTHCGDAGLPFTPPR